MFLRDYNAVAPCHRLPVWNALGNPKGFIAEKVFVDFCCQCMGMLAGVWHAFGVA